MTRWCDKYYVGNDTMSIARGLRCRLHVGMMSIARGYDVDCTNHFLLGDAKLTRRFPLLYRSRCTRSKGGGGTFSYRKKYPVLFVIGNNLPPKLPLLS